MRGFIDGTLFHQLLQMHHMLSSKLPVKEGHITKLAMNLEIIMFCNRVFHLCTWLITVDRNIHVVDDDERSKRP
jgi:uncharacterized membrane protein